MLRAIGTGYDAWGDEGTKDLFRVVNEIIFTVSLPLAGCQLFTRDPKDVKELMDIFARLEEGSTPSALIFPWIPTPTRFRRIIAGLRLYRMMKNLVKERESAEVDVDDPLQNLINEYLIPRYGTCSATILFAAVANTANLFAWTLVYLEHHREWKNRLRSEIELFLQDTGLAASDNLERDMADIPLSVIDEKLQVIELVMNEVLWLQSSGPFVRRNIGDPITIDGVHIPAGAFIMFPAADLHRNEELFPAPEVFDPTRFSPENIARRKEFGTSFIGWGASRHPCVGKRAALLEVKMMTILLMAKYHFELVDTAKSPLLVIPAVKVDRLFKVCGPVEPVNIRFRRRNSTSVETACH
ncbi:cytochrome P450 [Mycena metata]|uniref:Cytochrome P450 n=1 Tax=Mycena metata TaxID=1033252 RepID=A0AAD7JC63_9AGAR|nr:cytochrome P450 [Mycena metata]